MNDIYAVLGSPKKKEKTLEPTDRLWLLNHTKYKVTRKNGKFQLTLKTSHEKKEEKRGKSGRKAKIRRSLEIIVQNF